jgi:uncharacterized membrane protein
MLRDADPKHWKLIVFYYNPENRRLFVPKKTGFPSTINFARPMAWVLTALVLAALIFAAIVNN